MKVILIFLGIGVNFLFVACATTPPTPGANPGDMSAEAHEMEANVHEGMAHQHAKKYNPEAQVQAENCSGRASVRDDIGQDMGEICWTSVTNPTAEHHKEAMMHQKHAADHRKASKTLRDAEATACKLINKKDVDISPFAHGEDIDRVETKYSGGKVSGAVVYFRQVPGLNIEKLKSTINCHLARNKALGFNAKGMDYCPLAIKGVQARVEEVKGQLVVHLDSSDSEISEKILKTARSLPKVNSKRG